MDWWLWILVAVGLMAFEVATPGGFFAVFFGLGAFLVGVLAGFGLAGPPWSQWALFTGLSLGALALLRRPLRERLARGSQPVDTIVGETAVALTDLAPDAVGRAELRGTSWEARNAAAVALTAGQRCRVQRIDGLMLWIVPQ